MTRITDTSCRSCGKILDAATSAVAEGLEPQPGDISICFYCGHIGAYAIDMTIRELNDQEIIDCAGDPKIVHTMNALHKFKKIRPVD